LMEEIEAQAEAARGRYPNMAGAVWDAAEGLRETTEWLVAQEMNDRFAGAAAYLRAFARVLGAHFHLKAALADDARAPLARIAIKRLLPEHAALLLQAREGAQGLYDLTPEALGA